MKSFSLVCAILCTLTVSGQRKEMHNKAGIPFDKLAGNWISEKKNDTEMAESWIIIDKKSMAGKSFMIKNGDTAILETVQLREEGEDIFYIPLAYGQNDDRPVRFKLTSVKGSMYVFENPEHDFPKRIVYDFSGNNILHAYIDDGTINRRQHYHYSKKL